MTEDKISAYYGEPALIDPIDTLGIVIKTARKRIGMTRRELAAKLNITPKHLMRIENGKQKPSYNLLFRLIRELSLPVNEIFFPDFVYDHQEIEYIISMLYKCGKKELHVVTATLFALLE